MPHINGNFSSPAVVSRISRGDILQSVHQVVANSPLHPFTISIRTKEWRAPTQLKNTNHFWVSQVINYGCLGKLTSKCSLWYPRSYLSKRVVCFLVRCSFIDGLLPNMLDLASLRLPHVVSQQRRGETSKLCESVRSCGSCAGTRPAMSKAEFRQQKSTKWQTWWFSHVSKMVLDGYIRMAINIY